MKKTGYIAFLLLLCILFSSLASCKKAREKDDEAQRAEKMNIAALGDAELAAYAVVGQYKGLSIELGGRTRDSAVWEEITSRAEVKAVPEQQVRYYFEQSVAQYEYYAERANMSYDEMLAELDTTEEKMLSDARGLALGDIIFELVRRAEGIELSESEKREHLDRYAEKYVEDYGYNAEYVKEHLVDQIYESMLYDKVTEFLLSNNEIH